MSTAIQPVATQEQTTTLSRLSGFVQQIDAKIAALDPIDADELLKLSVTDAKTALLAKGDRASCKAYIDDVESILKEPTSIAHQLHKSFTTLRSKLTADALKVIEHHDKEVAAYAKAEREKVESLQRELQKQAEAAAKAEHARQEAERIAALENAMPWELPSAPEAPAPLVVPKVEVPRAPIAAGFGTRNLPWTYEVKDLMLLIKAVADGTVKFDAENPCLQINPAFFKAAAGFHKDKLSASFPGVEGVREQKVKY